MINIRIPATSFKSAQRKLSKAHNSAKQFERAHKKIAVKLDRWVQLNFRSQGQTLGSDRWPSFARGGRIVTKKGGSYLDESAKLLQDTGRLRGSFQPFWSRKTAGIGSDLSYSKQHQEGNESKNLPARRMLPKFKEVRRDIIETYEWHIKEAFR
jgi:phage gpG-like protein